MLKNGRGEKTQGHLSPARWLALCTSIIHSFFRMVSLLPLTASVHTIAGTPHPTVHFRTLFTTAPGEKSGNVGMGGRGAVSSPALGYSLWCTRSQGPGASPHTCCFAHCSHSCPTSPGATGRSCDASAGRLSDETAALSAVPAGCRCSLSCSRRTPSCRS